MADQELDVVAYLASKGMHGRQGNGAEVVYPCFFDCGEPGDSKKKKLYVNAAEGWYHCKVCDAKGGTTLLMRHFGDDQNEKVEVVKGANPARRRALLTESADLGARMLENNDAALLYLLNDRGLTPETIIERQLGVVPKGWSLTGSLITEHTAEDLAATGLVHRDGSRAGRDWFYSHLLIPYHSRGAVVQMRGRLWNEDKGARYLTGSGDDVRIYNVDDLDEADDVIITEGEFDAMVLKQHLLASPEDKVRRIAVVAVAGTNALPSNFESYFKDAKRVYIGFDSDDAGKKSAAKLKEIFGPRGRILELPAQEKACDWSDFLLPVPADADDMWKAKHPFAGHDWQDVLELINTSSGKRVFSMRETGIAWRNQKDRGSGIKTGYVQLDQTIEGILPGQLMIVLAKTGTGKTLFLCNLAYNMRDQKVLFISLEMTREEVYERLRRIFLFYHPRMTDEMMEFALSNIYVVDENRLSEQDFELLLEEFRVEAGCNPDVVFVDYLGYYARGQKGNSPYEKVSNAVMQLKAEAKKHHLAIISPSQVNRVAKEGKPIDLDDARDSGAIEETADFLLALWRPDDALTTGEDARAQPSGKVRLTILKSRHGGKDLVFSLQMDLLTLAIVDDGTAHSRRAQQHNQLAMTGQKFEHVIAAESRPLPPKQEKLGS